MVNKKLKNLEQLLVKLEAKKITLIRNQKYEEAKIIRDQMVEINEKLQNLFEEYNNFIDH
ncbi:UvrB/UvrC motif-containing protein [Faecalibacter sp. LW9]|uniref:UvrB/UvrC motif-containing protein n=1 Tax=Faecalibacter sp. LW9 TaxID=3103144 RepID=UPI002AFEBA3E|nr:UvrB/UvrC motif-containing protein [Faecalibacter sp. LW9]